MHPRQRIAVLKPQIALLNPRNRFARGVLGAWLFNDDGGLRGIGAAPTENYPPRIHDAGPYLADAYELTSGPDEMRSVDSPWGSGVYFPAGNYGEIRNDWGKFWNGLTAISTFAICRNRTASQRSNILTAGYSSTSTAKFAFEFTFGNNLYYYSRAGTEGAQGVTSVQTFSANEWHVVGGSGRVVNGGGVYKLFVDGKRIATTGTPNHSYSSFNGNFGTWPCRLGATDYTNTTWANIDIVFCMHWGWELTEEDFASLAADPYQAFHGVESSRYADFLLGEPPVPHYIVSLPKNTGQTVVSGDRTFIVEAASAAIAKNFVEALKDGDTGSWDDASATLVEATTEKYAGSTWRIKISGKPVPAPDLADVYYVAQTGDGIDEIGAGLVAALKGPGAQIPTAAYSGGTLTVAGAAENLGDRRLSVEITPPGAVKPIPIVTGMPVSDITDNGAIGAALSFKITDTGLPQLKSSA